MWHRTISKNNSMVCGIRNSKSSSMVCGICDNIFDGEGTALLTNSKVFFVDSVLYYYCMLSMLVWNWV